MTDREEFEESGITSLLSRSTEKGYTHEYADTHTQFAWRGWQAARTTAEQSRDSVIEQCTKECDRVANQAAKFSLGPQQDCASFLAENIRALKSHAAIESKPAEASEDRPVEIWHGTRKVTIHSDCVLRVWGENIATEMSDEPRTLQSVQEAVDWLYADAAIESQGKSS